MASPQSGGPLVNLPLNDGSGRTATDISGNGLTATLINNATWTTGVSGGAVNLDGNSLLEVPGSGLSSISSQITVAGWVYRSASYGAWQVIASRQVGTGAGETFWLGYLGGNYRWFVNTSAGYSNTNIGGTAPLNQWVHVAGTYDGSTVRLYVNGAQQFSVSHRGNLPAETSPVTVGGSYNAAARTASEGLVGKLDDFRIYNRALSDSEISQLYQSVSVATSQTPTPAPTPTPVPTPTPTPTPAPSTGAKTKLFPMGASETFGFVGPEGNPANNDGGYRRFLWERLVSTGYTNFDFVGSLSNGLPTIDPNHEGHNGWPTDLMSTYINGWMSTFTPDMVLLLAGANDLIMGAGPTTALNRLGTLLDQIHAARPSARILVGTWWYPRTGSDNPKFKPAEIQVYNAGVANLVNARAGLGWSIQRVDTGSRIDSASYSQDYGMDGLHLSPAGYKKVGDAWYSAITGR